MMRRAGLALLAALVAAPAGAQELGSLSAASVYGPDEGDAATVPTNAQIVAAWPARAAARQTGGSAVAQCRAAPSGELTSCQVVLQRPDGQGFGEALLSLAPRYRLQPLPAAERPDGSDAIITASWPAPDTAPDWRVPPKAGDFATTATDAAAKSGAGGRAVMNCLEGKLGTLYQCVVLYQEPAGKGFGTMLLRFAAYLRLKPALMEGKPIVYGINIPMTFGKPTSRFIY